MKRRSRVGRGQTLKARCDIEVDKSRAVLLMNPLRMPHAPRVAAPHRRSGPGDFGTALGSPADTRLGAEDGTR